MNYNISEIIKFAVSTAKKTGVMINRNTLNLIMVQAWIDYYNKTGNYLFNEPVIAEEKQPAIATVDYLYKSYGNNYIVIKNSLDLLTSIKPEDQNMLKNILMPIISEDVELLRQKLCGVGSAWQFVKKTSGENRPKIPFEVIISTSKGEIQKNSIIDSSSQNIPVRNIKTNSNNNSAKNLASEFDDIFDSFTPSAYASNMQKSNEIEKHKEFKADVTSVVENDSSDSDLFIDIKSNDEFVNNNSYDDSFLDSLDVFDDNSSTDAYNKDSLSEANSSEFDNTASDISESYKTNFNSNSLENTVYPVSTGVNESESESDLPVANSYSDSSDVFDDMDDMFDLYEENINIGVDNNLYESQNQVVNSPEDIETIAKEYDNFNNDDDSDYIIDDIANIEDNDDSSVDLMTNSSGFTVGYDKKNIEETQLNSEQYRSLLENEKTGILKLGPIKGLGKKLTDLIIVPRNKINGYEVAGTFAIISISSPKNKPITYVKNSDLKGILYLSFDDSSGKFGMQEKDAKKIAEFVIKMSTKVRTLIVQSDYGLSRSAGIVAAIYNAFDMNGKTLFTSEDYCPNVHCYKLLLSAFEIGFDENVINKLDSYNKENWIAKHGNLPQQLLEENSEVQEKNQEKLSKFKDNEE